MCFIELIKFDNQTNNSFLFEKIEIAAAIIAEDKNCAVKSKKPIFMLPKTPIPIAEIRKDGPAFTHQQSIFAAVFRSRKPSQTRSEIHFAAAGYPPKIAAGKTPQQIAGIFKRTASGFKRTAKKSAASLWHAHTL